MTTRPATSDELRAEVDRGWRAFRDAVRSLGRARFDEWTAAGWTSRDLVAHVAAWEALTAKRLRLLRLEGRREPPGGDPRERADGASEWGTQEEVDAFNARVAREHRLVGAEALLAELDASHGRLLDELELLDDAAVAAEDGWVAAVVAGNSFGHYREHAGELGL